ncbi:hypothetical protein [Nocardia gipuzkoensis]
MNLAWIAAVFSPYEIAEPPGYRDEERASRPEADLAAVLVGRTPSWERGLASATEDTAVLLASKALEPDTHVAGTKALVDYLLRTESASNDFARIAALTLIAAINSAALDDYESCMAVLNLALEATRADSAEYALCRAAILQQRFMRTHDRDSRSSNSDATEALSLLSQVDAGKVQKFALNSFTTFSSNQVVHQIAYALKLSVWSMMPTLFAEDEEPSSLAPTLKDRARARRSERLLTIQRDEAGQYSRWLSEQFDKEFRDSDQLVIGNVAPDQHLQLVAFELLGHSEAFSLRKEVAMMRIVSALPTLSNTDVSGCIRLLRQAGADDQLQLLLDRIVSGGPLHALLEDVRRINKYRMKFGSLRPGEMIVVGAGAELLPPSEAFEMLEIILELIRAGGPINPPRRYQAASKRQESAWLAAAALGATAGASGLVADELYDRIVRSSSDVDDELWDRVLRKVIFRLDWDLVPEDTRDKFQALALDGSLGESRQSWIGEALVRVLNLTPRSSVKLSGGDSADSIADAINEYLRSGSKIPEQLLKQAAQQSVSAMKKISQDAERGAFSRGGLEPAEMAAFLVEHTNDVALWNELLEFLTNPHVARWDRTRAFDVLAARRPSIPDAVRSRYISRVRAAVNQGETHWMASGSEIVPYPAALRFGFVYSMVDGREAFQSLAQLSALGGRKAREEAAETVSRFASYSGDDWIQVLAVQLSHDAISTVRVKAIRALAAIAKRGDGIPDIAAIRLANLLKEDGVTVPLKVLYETSGKLSNDLLKKTIVDLRTSHPSKRVRDRAARIISENEW